MNREIKFRAWDKINKKMDYEMTYAGNVSKDMNNAPGIGDGEDFSELMQFTGLLDKNGKEIYEGDIVRISSQYETDEPIESIASISFIDGGYQLDFHNMRLTENVSSGKGNWMIEVIGNIFENPNILEQNTL